MRDSVLTYIIIGRSLSCITAIGGAIWLAHADKPGWGWLIFLALILGCYSFTTNEDKD